jgi:hypothetical protein
MSNKPRSSSMPPLPGKNPSPRRAARCAARLVCPPITNGTVPFVGRGREMQLSKLAYLLWTVALSPFQSARIAST